MKILIIIFEVLLLFFSAYMIYPFVFFPFFYKKISRSILHRTDEIILLYNKFYFIIAAHNEENSIGNLLKSISSQNYPHEFIDVLVIADHCTDNTVNIIKSFNYLLAEKNDNIRNGKSEVLVYAANLLKNESDIQEKIIVIVDADCELETDFCTELNKNINQNPDAAVFQSFRKVKNINSSSISQMDASAEAIRQWVNQGVRHCLGLNVKMHGSGMAFNRNFFFESIEMSKGSLAEDQFWNAQILLNDKKIVFAPTAHLSYFTLDAVDKFSQQRKRWISGQFEVAGKIGFKLLMHGLLKFNFNKIDFALSLFTPPRSFLLISLLFLVLFSLISGITLLTDIFFIIMLIFIILFLGVSGVFLSGARMSISEFIFTGIRLVWNVFITTSLTFLGRKIKKW